MHIRYVYTNEHGREASRPVFGDNVPPIGATVAEYLSRPSDNRPQPAGRLVDSACICTPSNT